MLPLNGATIETVTIYLEKFYSQHEMFICLRFSLFVRKINFLSQTFHKINFTFSFTISGFFFTLESDFIHFFVIETEISFKPSAIS